MQAYAIFAGGGVKGAAFAGCLIEAEQRRVEFLGYGGTSAGSLVALLASIGYPARRIERIMLEEVDYLRFLGDEGRQLELSKALRDEMVGAGSSKLAWLKIAWGMCIKDPRFQPIQTIREKLGLYPGNHMNSIVRELIVSCDGFDRLRNEPEITFADLEACGAKPLKIVASDLYGRRARVFSSQLEPQASVLTAIRASTCYPFVFEPVKYGDNRHLVDGGLSSNLPVFLFNRERAKNRKPVIAFDLVVPNAAERQSYGITEYCGELLETALEAGNTLIRASTEAVYHVEIRIPEGISALKFNLTKSDKRLLYSAGRNATADFFNKQLPQAGSERNKVQAVQAAVSKPAPVEAVLRALAKEVESLTGASNTRCSVMLPSGNDMQIVAYQYGMDGDPDLDWEIALPAGLSGQARDSGAPVVLPLEELRTNPAKFGLVRSDINKIPRSRRTALCIPIYEHAPDYQVGRTEGRERAIIGTLTIDTESELEQTGWLPLEDRMKIILVWTDVLAKLLD